MQEWKDADMPKNQWYIKQEDSEESTRNQKQLIPVVQVSDVELVQWFKDRSLTLIINVLGKEVNFRVLENKVKCDWARTGAVEIIDMSRGYYVVCFKEEADYKHVLFEGLWMVLVQR